MQHRERTFYSREFRGSGSGFSFDCDAAGNIDESKLQPAALENLQRIRAGSLNVVDCGVQPYTVHERICGCGSGETPYPLHDGHGIHLTYACTRCEVAKLRDFRSGIMESYDADEPIEGDE